MGNKLKQEECGISVRLWGNQTKFINWIASEDNGNEKLRIFFQYMSKSKNANSVTLIIHLWIKCLIFWVFD